ncbi:hypothetical protein ACUN0C_19085 [Faunimonas sp. B44]|uniref:hypothetical protein n=1 Tax=Faunimonas sp. B44 TaxID=3461493 RepID=UPI004044D17B
MQETFDKVVRHLFAQGKQAKERDTCRYRTADGLMCAVGCLISDEDYDPSFEGQFVDRLPIRLPHIPLLRELQAIHDIDTAWKSPDRLYRNLKGVATYYPINTDALEEAYANADW